jgi:transcriptional antiterminator NusG
MPKSKGVRNVWYAIQTITGNEEKAMDEIGKVVDSRVCEQCFLLKREAVWRIQGACRIHTENIFPGYIFVRTQYPEEFYRQLKAVPQYTKILGKEDDGFYAVSKEEEIFLKRLLNKDAENTVRLSAVKVDEEGNIVECEGPLRHYMGYVVKKRIRLRFVVIRVHLFGRDREIMLGIRLDGDIG